MIAATGCAVVLPFLACNRTPQGAARDGGGSVGGASGSIGGGGSGGGVSGSAGSAAGGASTGVSANGSVLGATFVAVDVAATTDGAGLAGTYPYLEVTLVDYAGACGDIAGTTRHGSHAVRIFIFNEQDETAIGAGTYVYRNPAVGTTFAVVDWHGFDEACAAVVDLTCTSATVTLTEVSATRVVGSFEATYTGSALYPDAGAADAGIGQLSGTFSAPICPPSDAGATCD